MAHLSNMQICSVEIEAYDIEEAIRKFKDLNNSAEIESVEKTDKW